MAKYRKTALVDAEQFLPPDNVPHGVIPCEGSWALDTLEGRHTVREGDYICTGGAGEQWNVERTIFEATYELAE